MLSPTIFGATGFGARTFAVHSDLSGDVWDISGTTITRISDDDLSGTTIERIEELSGTTIVPFK